MYRRGVLLFLILLVTFVPAVSAGKVKGTLAGFVDAKGIRQELALQFLLKRSAFDLELGWDVSLGAYPLVLKQEPMWQIGYNSWPGLEMSFVRNQPHFTSADIFRLIHRNNYSPKTTVYWVDTAWLSGAWLWGIPFKKEELVTGPYVRGIFDLGALELGAAFLRTEGSAKDTFTVFDGRWVQEPWQALIGIGFREKSKNVFPAAVLELDYAQGPWRSNLAWQNLSQNFISPLASVNKYTPGRRGWHWKSSFSLGDVVISLNRREHSNLAGDRDYNQYSWKLSAKNYKTELEWRIQPTQAFLICYKGKKSKMQVDFVRQTLRFESLYAQTDYRFSFDAPRRIARLELRFDLGFQWRLIGKKDFLQERTNYSVLGAFENKNFRFAIELGTYDRGNIHAGFDAPAKASISWEWDF